MDLISRKAAIDRLNAIPPGNWSKARYTRELWNVPSVPAVPLDELCEWLAGYAEPPMDALTICDNPFEAWKMTLTNWMEEQDAQTEQSGK